MASETTTEMLRAAIEAALRRRFPSDADTVYVRMSQSRYPTQNWHADAHHGTDFSHAWGDDAVTSLRALAVTVGLRISDCPACGGRGRHLYAREVEDGCDACECAGVVVVDPAEEVARLDDVTRGALDDLARVRAELDEARVAVRKYLTATEETRSALAWFSGGDRG